MNAAPPLPAAPKAPLAITRELAAFAAHARFADLPSRVQAEAPRAFLNWMGCALGGSDDAAVQLAADVAREAGGHPQSSVIGHAMRTDMASAAFLNCLSSTVLSFDDTHLATVTHPTGPVAAALFAYCEHHPVSGEDFAAALAVGIEVQCRLSNVLLLPPAHANIGLFITGITGPIGAAAAVARVMRLDEQHVRWAMGLAAAQASGIRGTHGGMAAFFIPAHAARSGVSAAMLAAKGMTCPDHVLEGPKGFVEVFGRGGELLRAVEGLGSHYEMLCNAYKPYPSGIVVHPAIDACMEVAARLPAECNFESVKLRVHPLALELCGRREPANPVEAQISLFHWAAACLVQRAAGIAQLSQAAIDHPGVAALRARLSAEADPSLQRDEAHAEVTLATGEVLRSHVANARGSVARPMTDGELDAKFRAQAIRVLSADTSEQLLRRCLGLAALADVGHDISAVWAMPDRHP